MQIERVSDLIKTLKPPFDSGKVEVKPYDKCTNSFSQLFIRNVMAH